MYIFWNFKHSNSIKEIVNLLLTVQDIVFQLQKFVSAMARYHNDCHTVMKEAVVFPIEVDLSRGTFTYDTSNQFNDGEDEEEEEEETEDSHTAMNNSQTGDLISTDWGGQSLNDTSSHWLRPTVPQWYIFSQ